MMSECTFVKMYTKRIADNYWNSLGYERAYTEYVKKLGDTSENL